MKLGEEKEIQINRKEANFDRACDEAFMRGISMCGIDDDGHSDIIKGWNRSNCWIEVEFKKYFVSASMSGINHSYIFVIKTYTCEDEI